MEKRENMKILYILLVLILAVSALGCVGNKPSEVVSTPSTQVEISVSPTETPGNDEFGTQSDISTIDTLINDSSMDIPLYDVNI